MLFLDDVAYYLTECGCIPLHLARLVSLAYNLIRVGVPVALVIVGMITLTKSILGQKEDDLKKAQSSVIKKVVAAVLVFLVMTLVQSTLNLVSGAISEKDKNNMWKCVTFMLTGEGNLATSQVCNVTEKEVSCVYNPVTFKDGKENVNYDKKIIYTASAKLGSERTYSFDGEKFSALASKAKLYTEIACPRYWVHNRSTYVGGGYSTSYIAYDSLYDVDKSNRILKLGS